jgi:hypothetical protein
MINNDAVAIYKSNAENFTTSMDECLNSAFENGNSGDIGAQNAANLQAIAYGIRALIHLKNAELSATTTQTVSTSSTTATNGGF